MEEEKEDANNQGRLCLKLKITPKPEPTTADQDMINGHDQKMMINKLKPDDHEQVEDHVQDEELLPFVCPVCNKRYKSGKALGGHKRMHNLPPKNNNNSTKPSNKRKAIIHDNDEEDDEEEEDVPICPLCEKSFPSMKSLFGHMRSHPDRGWRGIQPPPQPSSSTVPDQDHPMIDDDDDSSEATPKKRRPVLLSTSNSPKTPSPASDDLKWPITAKRGSGNRITTSGSSSSSSGGLSLADVPWMEKTAKEAVFDLMMLACQKPGARSELLTILDRINKNKGKAKKEEEKEEEEEENSGDEKDYYMMKRIKNKSMKSKKIIKKMKLADLEEEEGEEGQVIRTTSTSNSAKSPASSSGRGRQYVCSVCKRSFPSYQALGGHRSSHNKKNIKIIINSRLSNSDDSSRSEEATDDKDNVEDDQVSAENDDSKIVKDFDLNEVPTSED
ncbi:Zinc finger protein ZAT2 [Morus notabilis]|uniref:Zinc finger protein ZAT2 n=1 Tax=Morus notabilis TaxID=981085 RepID=W9QY41_9ROSA|nr:zinc finger protein ZAT4 [Morus notabilis]EXB50702.1 Zinc finger protein ZAT2 [Morus notabilis]